MDASKFRRHVPNKAVQQWQGRHDTKRKLTTDVATIIEQRNEWKARAALDAGKE